MLSFINSDSFDPRLLQPPHSEPKLKIKIDLLAPLRRRLNAVKIHDPGQAHLLCRLIPAQCPFERDLRFGTWAFHIPPLCKLNPLYEELVSLRFQALSFLADECGEDVTPYCR